MEVKEMAEKLTMKALSEELETLRKRLRKMETEFERKLESTLEKVTDRLKARIEAVQGQPLHVQRHGAAVDTGARRRLIAETAYLRAERRGFSGGNPDDDWLEAEREVDQLLLEGWVKTTADEPARSKGAVQETSRL
jgi:hypothetical protein